MAPAVPKSEPQWPPRSPREALLSTPSGRQRYRAILDQTSPSPSPSRQRSIPMLQSARLLQEQMDLDTGDGEDDDDDDDEETLQLKLQEIQARLKLKRLQNARAKGTTSATGQRPHGDGGPKAEPAATLFGRQPTIRGTTPEEQSAHPRAQNTVQVPASPIRKLQAPQQQTSPSRVLLGIDKGLRAKDVSLKRASSIRQAPDSGSASHSGTYVDRSRAATSSAPAPLPEPPRPKSFNERLASVRSEETVRAERQEKIQQLRSNAFKIGQEEIEEYKKSAVEIPDEPLRAPTFTRDEILSKSIPRAGSLPRGRTLGNLTSGLDEQSSSTLDGGSKNDAPDDEASSFEPYSCFHLSRRILPHRVLARHVSGKKTLSIKEVLKDVKAPDFSLPDVEQDIVIFAMLAKKSEPRAHKPTAAKNGVQSEDRGKYMIMTLVDLDFELDLFLFNTGFSRFWKLTEGTVVAILNPSIMPPPPGRQDTGRFSLVINSDEDTILEIGIARDLGSCKSVKKDGSVCGSWVNKKRTEFCEFHSNEAVRKTRASRVEINSAGFGSRERGKKKEYGGAFAERQSTKNKNYDWETRTQWFASRSHSAADLIDGKDRAPADRKERAEFIKRGLEAKEKEREIMKKLGTIGDAAGREYMQRSGSRTSNNLDPSTSSGQAANSSAVEEAVTNPLMDLMNAKDRNIHLSPVKRKRPDSSQAGSIASSSKSSSAYGWGSSLKSKLSNMKEGEKFRKEEQAPVRKKTRFVTEKGIREAGRESLGMDLSERQVVLDDDDDDELVIVR